ncbi:MULTISPECIES: carbohydrate ABC transporter permease [Oceanotoga]|jgi:raffinose/stachyose/melibiose transport system permease protein|uniref:carbohydrate ABC transporter permease n=1 Tax=Oceanotoga TaxID=1255275 RepID=UPI00264DDBC2|nr:MULTISPECIES: sugar ABC transporter permease [Oceanotoga]MDN5343051.1 raffinose/stachyose/melibiose transport system permease protein [Oceanotoga sp.]MDO7976639.1 sugar ABC transporter permease [Oceanotoga teriensis]
MAEIEKKYLNKIEKLENKRALSFLSPAFLFLILFMAYPVFYSFYLSFFKWNGAAEKIFIGFSNYKRIFQDSIFWKSLTNNISLSLLTVIFQVFLALIIAYWLVRVIKKGRKIFLFLYLIPIVISEICIGLLWNFIYNPYFGLINGVLRGLNLDFLTRGWVGDPSTAFLAVINAMNFTYIGMYILLFVAAIQDIPESIFDASKIDGANNYKNFFSVVIPMIQDSIQSTSLLCIINSFKTFTLTFVLTNGGPNHSSEVLSTYLYKVGFNDFEMGYSATIGCMQLIITIISGLIILKLIGKSKAYS